MLDAQPAELDWRVTPLDAAPLAAPVTAARPEAGVPLPAALRLAQLAAAVLHAVPLEVSGLGAALRRVRRGAWGVRRGGSDIGLAGAHCQNMGRGCRCSVHGSERVQEIFIFRVLGSRIRVWSLGFRV